MCGPVILSGSEMAIGPGCIRSCSSSSELMLLPSSWGSLAASIGVACRLVGGALAVVPVVALHAAAPALGEDQTPPDGNRHRLGASAAGRGGEEGQLRG